MLPKPQNRDKYPIAIQVLTKAFTQNTRQQKTTKISTIMYQSEFK